MSLSLEPKPSSEANVPPSTAYLAFSPEVERPSPDEPVIFDELSRTMQHITRSMAARYRHAYRPVHAKSHGLLVGSLVVAEGLPEHLAQGIFAHPGTYPVILRFSTNPGDLLADNVSTPKGLAIKILGVPGVPLANHAGNTTQDIVCVNADAFSAPDPAGFLAQLKLFDKTLDTSEGIKHAVSVAARATNAVIGVAGLHSATLEGVGAPAVHILGESFTTVAPLRYGSYVAKLGVAPESSNLKELKDKAIDLDADYNALGELVHHFFRKETAVWAVKVQLALASADASKNHFPVEDATKSWPAEESPWQTVARITVKPQETYSDERQRFVDEQLSFSPWHGMEAHRPLGGIMRSRLKAYEEAAKYRAQRNGHPHVEPTAISEVPA